MKAGVLISASWMTPLTWSGRWWPYFKAGNEDLHVSTWDGVGGGGVGDHLRMPFLIPGVFIFKVCHSNWNWIWFTCFCFVPCSSDLAHSIHGSRGCQWNHTSYNQTNSFQNTLWAHKKSSSLCCSGIKEMWNTLPYCLLERRTNGSDFKVTAGFNEAQAQKQVRMIPSTQ